LAHSTGSPRDRRVRGLGLRAAAAGLLCLGLAARLPAEKWKDPTPEEKAIVEDASNGLVGAVYLEKKMVSSNQMFDVKVRAKILSKSGFDVATVEGIDPNAQFIEGRTVSPSGKVTELSSKDIRTVTAVKAAGRSVEHKVFTLPALEPGAFVEYSYREWGWLGASSDYHVEVLFQDKYPVLHQELHTPKRFPFSSSLRRQKGVVIEYGPEGNEYVYKAANAPALHDEVYGLPKYERSAAVIFAWVFPGIQAPTAESFWVDATKKGLAPLLNDYMVKPSKVEKALKEIPGSRASDPKTRLRGIYDYAQKTVKNRWTLRPGEVAPKGGWKHNENAADALSHGYGTPWDIASVCASLLKADGWKFRAVFTPDREERFFHPEIPSMFQFGGWIIEVRDPGLEGPVYLCFDHPLQTFGELTWSRVGSAAYAIDLDAQTGEKIEIPQLPPEKNSRHRAWTVTLAEDGNVSVRRESHLDGAAAFDARVDLYAVGREANDKKLREAYQKMDPPGEIESVSYENEEKPGADFVQTTVFRRNGLGGSLPGGRVELAPLTMIGESNPFTQERRDEPIMFPYPYLQEDTLVVTPPDGYAPDALPPPVELHSLVGRYSARASKGDKPNTVVVSRTLTVSRFSASPDFYPEYRRLFEAAARGDAGLSLVFKKDAPAKAAR
jgi:hypothetical protein